MAFSLVWRWLFGVLAGDQGDGVIKDSGKQKTRHSLSCSGLVGEGGITLGAYGK